MPSALERRILNFLATLPGAESLDDILAGKRFAGERRADYLLFGRRVIIEVKSLEADSSAKVETVMEPHQERAEYPLFYGKVELSKVLKHLPDGDEINRRIFYRVTRSVEDATRSAEDQIENTAKLLQLNDSVGVLVMLNENVDILTPEAVASRVGRLMKRLNSDGSHRSPIAFAWLHFESHVLVNGPAKTTLPIIVLEGPLASRFPWFHELLEYLHVAWAHFNGHPLVHNEAKDLSELKMGPASSGAKSTPNDRITRHELWERQYSKHPYLRDLSDHDVLRRGKEVADKLSPYFEEGGPRASPDQIMPLMIEWSDFLCEARYRGLDLRGMHTA